MDKQANKNIEKCSSGNLSLFLQGVSDKGFEKRGFQSVSGQDKYTFQRDDDKVNLTYDVKNENLTVSGNAPIVEELISLYGMYMRMGMVIRTARPEITEPPLPLKQPVRRGRTQSRSAVDKTVERTEKKAQLSEKRAVFSAAKTTEKPEVERSPEVKTENKDTERGRRESAPKKRTFVPFKEPVKRSLDEVLGDILSTDTSGEVVEKPIERSASKPFEKTEARTFSSRPERDAFKTNVQHGGQERHARPERAAREDVIKTSGVRRHPYKNGYSARMFSPEKLEELKSSLAKIDAVVEFKRKEFEGTPQEIEYFLAIHGKDETIMRYAVNKQTLQLQGKDTPLFAAIQVLLDGVSADEAKNCMNALTREPIKSAVAVFTARPQLDIAMLESALEEIGAPEEEPLDFVPPDDAVNLMVGVRPKYPEAFGISTTDNRAHVTEPARVEKATQPTAVAAKPIVKPEPVKMPAKAEIAAKNKLIAKAEIAHKALAKRIPYAMAFLSEQSRVDFEIGLTEFGRRDLKLADYSCLLVSPYRGLERFIFDLQTAKGITVKMIGQAFDKDDEGHYLLKSGYRKKIDSVVYAEVMAALYTEYFSNRNFFAHSDNSVDNRSRMIDDKTGAKGIFENLLSVIEYNAKKLTEINFRMI